MHQNTQLGRIHPWLGVPQTMLATKGPIDLEAYPEAAPYCRPTWVEFEGARWDIEVAGE